MSDTLTIDYDEIEAILSEIEAAEHILDGLAESHSPSFRKEHYMTGPEICEVLHISIRTLQYYRDHYIVPYTIFGGKALYRESDIQKMLDANYCQHIPIAK